MGPQLEGNLLNEHADFVPIAFAFLHFFSFIHVEALCDRASGCCVGRRLSGLGLRQNEF